MLSLMKISIIPEDVCYDNSKLGLFFSKRIIH